MGVIRTPVCPFCGNEDETVAHLLWHCPRWQAHRIPLHGAFLESYTQSMPQCARLAGVLPLDPKYLDRHPLTDEIPAITCAHSFRQPLPSHDLDAWLSYFGIESPAFTYREARVTVWTDGSCLDPTYTQIATAASAVYFYDNCPCNCLLYTSPSPRD